MVSWIIPIVRQSKTDLIHRQEMRPLRHGGSHFTKWLPPWRKGRISCLWIKSVFDCLTIGIIHETMVVHMTWVWTFFNNYSNHPRMCVLSTLCGNVDKHSPFDIYIYIYICVCVCCIDVMCFRIAWLDVREHVLLYKSNRHFTSTIVVDEESHKKLKWG